jgi:membrane-bound metal-dependent hydrolase YbcI (DUF457 family)
MTLPEHLFIGLSLGNTLYAAHAFCKRRVPPFAGAAIICGLMAILPDIDSFFGHYESTDVFIGHRGITHSILFILAVSMATAALTLMPPKRSADAGDGVARCRRPAALFLLCVIGGLSHLAADLPQPPGIWGGIPLFFPLMSGGEFVRTGGWAMAGWYDYQVMWCYFLLFPASLLLLGLYGILRRRGLPRASLVAALCVILLNVSAYAWTVRHVAAGGYTDFAGWNSLQERRLDVFGPTLKAATLKGRDRFLVLFHRIR